MTNAAFGSQWEARNGNPPSTQVLIKEIPPRNMNRRNRFVVVLILLLLAADGVSGVRTARVVPTVAKPGQCIAGRGGRCFKPTAHHGHTSQMTADTRQGDDFFQKIVFVMHVSPVASRGGATLVSMAGKKALLASLAFSFEVSVFLHSISCFVTASVETVKVTRFSPVRTTAFSR